MKDDVTAVRGRQAPPLCADAAGRARRAHYLRRSGGTHLSLLCLTEASGHSARSNAPMSARRRINHVRVSLERTLSLSLSLSLPRPSKYRRTALFVRGPTPSLPVRLELHRCVVRPTRRMVYGRRR